MSSRESRLKELWYLGGRYRRGLLFVLECYLDDSNNSSGPSLGIAGFLSHVDYWEALERAVEPILSGYNVSLLRGKDFHNGHNDFKNWDGPKKRQFVDDLFSVAGRYIICGINSTINKGYYKKLKAQDRTLSNLSPLGAAFASAVTALAAKDIPNHPAFHPVERLSFVVESGNNSNNNLPKYFHWLKKNWGFPGVPLGDLRFVEKRDCRAVQLADFLAFHGRREADRWAKEGYPPAQYINPAMVEMLKFVQVRNNRLYDDGRGMRIGNPFVPQEHENALILPARGL